MENYTEEYVKEQCRCWGEVFGFLNTIQPLTPFQFAEAAKRPLYYLGLLGVKCQEKMTQRQIDIFTELLSRIDSGFINQKENFTLPEQGIWQIAFYKARSKYENVSRWLRKKLDLTQEELAEMVGTTKRVVASWESEGINIPPKNMEKMKELAQKNGLDIEMF